MMKTNIKILNSEKNRLKFFYIIFFLIISVTLTYVGCSDVQNNLVMAPEIGTHPDGWGSDTGSVNFHGKYIYDNNAWNLTQCKSCHGSDYKGGVTGTSCLTCHTSSGGPQNCRLCHGGTSGHANPPKALNHSNSVSTLGVGVHVYHLDSTKYSADVECTECHLSLSPGGFNSPNHLGENPDGIAEINFGPLSMTTLKGGTPPVPVWDRNTATCSNVYCHGDFDHGNNATPVWTDPNSVVCGSCHGDPNTGNPTPQINGVFEEPHFSFFTAQTCYVCHGSVINPDGIIYDKQLHVNGEINY